MNVESGEPQDDRRQGDDTIRPYVYHDMKSDETHISPFVATVSGVGGEFFGVGRVIGQESGNPVIEVRDCNNGGLYLIMGYESWWTPGEVKEISDKVRTGELPIDSVADYLRSLDERSRIAQAEDEAFLLQNGIDPELG